MIRIKTTSDTFTRSKGEIEIILLIIIVLASIFFVGGISFKPSLVNPDTANVYVPIPAIPSDSYNTLQLKTLNFKGCSGTITVDFLLDRTGSMSSLTPSGKTKIQRLKEAVLDLTSKLTDDSVVGIQSFSSLGITNDVPISYYKDVKNIIPNKVNELSANGSTPTHDALAFSYERLQEAIPQFKDRQFNFILISDGAPVPSTQDPRLFNPNPADQIKNLGVNIITLAVYDRSQAKDPKLRDLLKSIASKPENYYEAENADELKRLLESISSKLCK